MLIAQMTDLHIKPVGKLAFKRVDTAACLERAVAWLNRLVPAPDVVLATGDLVDVGTAEEYARLKGLLRPLEMPLFLIPGNHDAREPLREAFTEHTYLPRTGEFLQYTVEGYPLRLIGLDTLKPGVHGGLLCAERLAWLEARLAEQPGRPTLLFMHHPPFLTGIAAMDKYGLENAEAFAQVVRRHGQVERVVCGHVHRAIQTRWAGTIASIAPSTAHQVALNLTGEGDLTFTEEPPGVQLLWWQPGLGLIGHLATVDRVHLPFSRRTADAVSLA